MPIVVNCPDCSLRFKAPDRAAGKRVKCPKCASILSVPAAEEDEEQEAVVTQRRTSAPARKRPAVEEDEEEPRPSARKKARAEQPGTGLQMGLGIGALVLGIIGLLFDFVPCVGWFVGLPAASLGLVVGLVAFIIAAMRQWRGIGFPIAGSIVSVFGIGGGLIWLAVWVKAGQAANEEAKRVDEELKKGNDPWGGGKIGGPSPAEKAEQWTEFTTKLGDFKVSVPGKSNQLIFLPGQVVGYLCSTSRGIYSTDVSKMEGQSVERALAEASEKLPMQPRVTADKRITLEGHPGREFETVDEKGHTGKVRAYVVGRYLVSLRWETVVVGRADPDRERFLGSLRLPAKR